MIKLNTSQEDMELITQRVTKDLTFGRDRKRVYLMMDLEVCHEICPLDLKGLLNASLIDFSHDIYGIVSQLNRRSYQLMDCFIPRFAKANHPKLSELKSTIDNLDVFLNLQIIQDRNAYWHKAIHEVHDAIKASARMEAYENAISDTSLS